jgi:hypothetical protein
LFKDKIKPEATPERVYELCRIVSAATNYIVDDSKLREIIEPSAFATSTAYYPTIKNAAVELGLVQETEGRIEFVGERKAVKDMKAFRKYCNSVLFNDMTSEFYKLCYGFLEANDEWLYNDSITSDKNARKVSEFSSFPVNDLKKTLILATRFWISFLGFGYIQETPGKIMFLPNAYIALKDFVQMAEIEKNKEYSVAELLDILPSGISVALGEGRNNRILNLAMSNALRQLHDMKEIRLECNSDSEEVWTLFLNNSHEFQSHITHIVYKGVK